MLQCKNNDIQEEINITHTSTNLTQEILMLVVNKGMTMR